MMRFVRETDGASATEYAVMLALIVLIALAAITGVGTQVSSIFTRVETALTPQ